MKPDRIFIIRHGESEGNVDKSMYATVPDHRISLTQNGIDQARRVGDALQEYKQSACIYTSSYRRAWQTAELIAASMNWIGGVPITEDCRLREQEWGNLRAQEASEKMAKESSEYGKYYYRFDNGESCADVFVRMRSFIYDLKKDWELPDFPRTCIISTHGMAARIFIKAFITGITVEDFEKMVIPANGCGYIITRIDETQNYYFGEFNPQG